MICVKRTYAPSKSKGKQNDEHVAMGEEMTEMAPAQNEGGSEQWSSVESLNPLGKQLIQIPVSYYRDFD